MYGLKYNMGIKLNYKIAERKHHFVILFTFLLVLSLIGCGFKSYAELNINAKSGSLKGKKSNSHTIPLEKSVPEKSVSSGEKAWIYGEYSLSAGGNGKNFIIKSGGEAFITARKSVKLLPGTRVLPGGKLVIKVKKKGGQWQNGKNNLTKRIARPFSKSKTSDNVLATGYKLLSLPESDTISIANNLIQGVLPVRIRYINLQIFGIPGRCFTTDFANLTALLVVGKERSSFDRRWGERPETIGVLRT